MDVIHLRCLETAVTVLMREGFSWKCCELLPAQPFWYLCTSGYCKLKLTYKMNGYLKLLLDRAQPCYAAESDELLSSCLHV